MTAPFVMLVVIWSIKPFDKNLPSWASWYDTPDEEDLVGLYEDTVKSISNKFGWLAAAYYWFGLRNKAHGFQSLFAKPAIQHWPKGWNLPTASVTRYSGSLLDLWIYTRRIGPVLAVFGWQIYSSSKFATGLEARPVMTLKYRPTK